MPPCTLWPRRDRLPIDVIHHISRREHARDTRRLYHQARFHECSLLDIELIGEEFRVGHGQAMNTPWTSENAARIVVSPARDAVVVSGTSLRCDSGRTFPSAAAEKLVLKNGLHGGYPFDAQGYLEQMSRGRAPPRLVFPPPITATGAGKAVAVGGETLLPLSLPIPDGTAEVPVAMMSASV